MRLSPGKTLSVCLFLLLFLLPLQSHAGLPEATAWLQEQTNSGGGYAIVGDVALPVQATSEAVRALGALGIADTPEIAAPRLFLQDNSPSSAEFLARLIIDRVDAGESRLDLVSQLLTLQNPDGGFGSQPGYHSTAIDTAYALEALGRAGLSSTPQLATAIGYLQTNVNSDGGWSLAGNDTSYFVTAQVSTALQQFRFAYALNATIASANQLLLDSRLADGSVGSGFETALAVIALAGFESDKSRYQPLVDYLTGSQSVDGSWENRVYVTALSMRALHLHATNTPPDPAAVSVQGTVTDRSSGAPLADALVTVQTVDGTLSATTDASGQYLLSGLTAGGVSLTAEKAGYFPAAATATLAAGATLAYSPSLVPNPDPIPITLTGRVLDADTGTPVEAALVSVSGLATQVATGADGSFTVGDIPAGVVSVLIAKDGYIASAYTVSAPAGGPVAFGDIALVPGEPEGTTGSVSGVITDSVTGEPLRGVEIVVSGADNAIAYTGSNGEFLIQDVEAGAVTISASLDGYSNAAGSGELLAGTVIQFNAALVKEINDALVTLQGLVVDADSGLPLEGVLVELTTGESLVTAADGAIYIGGIQAGQFDIRLSLAGYNPAAYRVTAGGGDLVDLATVRMSPDDPVSGNLPPVITSAAPATAVAGEIYQYNVAATDPEGETLIYGLSQNPGGVEIDSATGVIRWIPTTQQTGPQSFTVVVSDPQGGLALQTVDVIVSTTYDPSYIITDVQTLNGLTVDALLPDNYVTGTYVTGGRSGTWRATSPDGCGFGYTSGGSDFASIKAAAEALDFNSMGSGYGSDAIWDLGVDFNTVSVLPLIDHEPFPAEGIEYTIWGSDDPNAPFPEGWRLATLVSIYSKGWADNEALCPPGVNIDDYAGLYTFGEEAFRYIRLKADNSISIFDTPEHDSWSSYSDDSSLPGWQSVESEIDGVVGMVCDAPPIAEAGEDIFGQTGETVAFDASGSSGDIVTYGWDIDGDDEIDLTGATPSYTFSAGFDGTVSLLVVDSFGCVGKDTLNVTIDLDYPRPDLVVTEVNPVGLVTNVQTLDVNGTVEVLVANIGNAPASVPAQVVLFEDLNGNLLYDASVDNALGSITAQRGLARDEELTVEISVNGSVRFRDAPIVAMVDSDYSIDEQREDNNTATSADVCKALPVSLGDFDLLEKWYWPGAPEFSGRDVYGPVAVAQLTDDNGDGVINAQDDTDILFSVSASGGNGRLVAVDGATGAQHWINTTDVVSGYGSPAVADIDGDGIIEIVIPNRDRTRLLAFEHDGVLKWSSITGPRFTSTPRDAVAIADIDHDGDAEIVHGRRVYDHLGNFLWQGSGDYGGDLNYGTLPIVVDVDMQGDMEIVAGRSAYRSDGTTLWHRSDLPSGGGFTAVGNFNADAYPEIVLITGQRVYLLDHTGQTLWGPVSIPGGGYGGAPTVGDFDGDGMPEIGIAGANYYFVLETNGAVKWTSRTRDASSSRTGSSLFDFNLDGKVEVVYADEYYLRIYDGETGAVIQSRRIGSGTTLEYPVIADIDNDSRAEIVLGSNNSGYSSRRGLLSFEGSQDNWAPTRAIWNQHTYHIDNINDDGTLPLEEAHSWLSHNTYRLNTFPDRNPINIPDLSLSMLTVDDAVPSSISVRLGNGGSDDLRDEILVAFYEGAPEEGGTLLGTVAVDTLATGDYIDISLDNIPALVGDRDIVIIADFDDRVSECNETNNRVSAPVFPGSTAAEILVATDSPSYAPGSNVMLQGTITNSSSVPGEFSAQLIVEDADATVIQVFSVQQLGILAGNEAVNINEPWNTGALLAGGYRLHGLLFDVDGQQVDESYADFSILAAPDGEPVAALRTTTDRPLYHTTDLALIDDLMSNLSGNLIISGAVLRVQVFDPNGTRVMLQEEAQAEIASNGQRLSTLPYSFTDAPEGQYRVLGELLDAEGNLLASDEAFYEVAADLQFDLTGEVTVALASLYVGETQNCADRLRYSGGDLLAGQPVRRVLVRLDVPEEIALEELNLDLASGDGLTLERTVETAGLEPGFYACVLMAEIDGSYEALDSADFQLLEPPINIDSSLTLGSRGRLLVLLDEPATNGNANCNGVVSMTLTTDFPPLAGTDALFEATLYDSKLRALQQELGSIDSAVTPINLTLASGEADLVITTLDETGAEVLLSGETVSSGKLGKAYSIDGLLTETGGSQLLSSGEIPTSCTDALGEGDLYGDFYISDLELSYPANVVPQPLWDPEREHLEALLSGAGWSYTIVTDRDAFADEFHSGGYDHYLLLSDSVKLDNQVLRELREAVFNGAGLVVAGTHDDRNHHLYDALGVQQTGKASKVSGFALLDSDLHPAASQVLAISQHPVKIETAGAEPVAYYLDQHGLQIDEAALTHFGYGEGMSVYSGIDLLLEALVDPVTVSLYDTLLLEALDLTAPESIGVIPNGVVPVRLQMLNAGIDVAGRILLRLPDGVEVVDAGGALQGPDNLLTWPYAFISGEQLSFMAWLLMPDSYLTNTLEADIQTGEAPDFDSYEILMLDLVPLDQPSLDEAIDAMLLDSGLYADALAFVTKAQQETALGNHLKAVRFLLKATDILDAIGDSSADQIRQWIDNAIRETARNLVDGE